MKEQIDELIQRRKEFTFEKNRYWVEDHASFYSRPSEEVLAWIAIVEDFIIQNYGKDSAVFRLYLKFDDGQLKGNYQETFDNELNKLVAVLKACQEIEPQRSTKLFFKENLLEVVFDKFHAVTCQLRRRYNSRNTLRCPI